MKECELCSLPARMYCDSDQASLCWDCDAKVHCANFLVARHSRCLLCHACQSPTPWKASGPRLGPTVSVCERCVNSCDGRHDKAEVDEEKDGEGGNKDEETDSEDESDDDEDEDDGDDNGGDEVDDHGDGDGDGDNEDGDNQVVPWSSKTPPPIPSSSSSEESSSRYFSSGGVSGTVTALPLKRMRENVDLCPQDGLYCSSSQPNYSAALAAAMARTAEEETSSFCSFGHSKNRKKSTIQTPQDGLKPAALVSSLKQLEQKMLSGDHAATAIIGICKLSKDPGVATLLSNESPNPPI